MKKVVSLLLVVTMMFTMFLTPSAAQETAEDGQITSDASGYLEDLLECLHEIFGGILAFFDLTCPICWEVHGEDDGIYIVTFDLNYEGAPDSTEQEVLAGEYAKFFEPSKRDGYVFVGWYELGNQENLFDFENSKIEKDMTLIGKWYDLSDGKDTDEDNLPDQIEEYFNTDINSDDTDGDGLSDYIEVIVLELSPIKEDSDGNMVSDGEEDSDTDGLNNKIEVGYGSNPIQKDTDNDGLSDFEEMTIGTNLCCEDTDNDDVSDKKEIDFGTNPLVAESLFNIALTCEDSAEGVNASVEICLPGEIAETLSVNAVNDNDLFPMDMPGYLGKPYEFEVDGVFEEATIKFEFDENKLSSDAIPTIYYFNESEQRLEPLDTEIIGNVASAKTTHFSKYILLDRKAYEESFSWIDVWDANNNYTNAEIVLVIDDSGSLGGDYSYNSSTGYFTGGQDPKHLRLDVAKSFVDDANENSKIGIVKFDKYIDNLTNGLVKCNEEGKAKLKSYLKFTYRDDSYDYNLNGVFDSRGQTYMYAGIEKALGMFSETSENTMKVIVAFTDGNAWDAEEHTTVMNRAVSNNVKVYTVGLGTSSDYFNDYLKPLAVNTGGAFYATTNANQLSDIYKNISQKIDIETDTDGDGIPDYYEENLVTFSGVNVHLDKNNPDTDSDGWLDGQEIELKYEYNADKSKVKVTGKIISQPDKKRRFTTVAQEIPRNKITNDINMNIQEIHPLLGLTTTMMELSTDASNMLDNVPVAIDAFDFVCSWIENSVSITQLNVTTSQDNTMSIKYGSSIELNLSGKKTSLSSLIVDKYYSYSPSIVFSANKKADECIRNWFGLSGGGTYSMQLDFGRVYVGDYGYYLIYENGEFYQVPIIHEDTTMYVYYKEGKEVKKLFDAAEILRGTRIKLSEEEKAKVIEQLKKNGFEPV